MGFDKHLTNIYGKREREPKIPQGLEDKYKVSKKILGRGSFAVVKQCTDRITNKNYALKILSKKSIKGKERMISSELDVLKKVHHAHIISLHELYETKDGVFIITNLATGGELFHQLLLKGSYTEAYAAKLVRQILEGVAYLHDLDIVHRDLKPENLLFNDKSKDANLMITDFGLSKFLTNENDLLSTACGTPGYVAPEVLLGIGYSKPVDIWSIGVITYTLLCGYAPFRGKDQVSLFETIKAGVYEYEKPYCNNSKYYVNSILLLLAKDLIDKMLIYDPSRRIIAKEALEHPWFKLASNNDIYKDFKNNSSARKKFKKAVNLVRGINRI
ncbi:9495_t:CDS:2, partial [Entrophospora sp. SA101]